jgi:hypothetical protein
MLLRVGWVEQGGHRRGGRLLARWFVGSLAGHRRGGQHVADGLQRNDQCAGADHRTDGQHVADDRQRDGLSAGADHRRDGLCAADDHRTDGQRVADGRQRDDQCAERGQNFGCWGERMRVAERHQTPQSQDVHFVRQAASQRAWAWTHLVRR